MIQKIKRKLIVLATLLTLVAPVAVPVTVLAAQNPSDTGNAQIQGSLCQGANQLAINNTDQSCSAIDTESGGTSRVNSIIKTIINVFSIIVGVVAVIMIIFGGFRYITSGGKQESISSAKNTILYAIIGLIIVALAQIIVKFVLSKAAG